VAPNSITLFLDESGDPGWRPPRGKSATRYFVLGGLALDAEKENVAQARVSELVQRYLGIPPGSEIYELRFSDLYARRGDYRRLTLAQAQQMEADVLNLLLGLNPTLFATVVDKDRHQSRYGVKAYHPKEMALAGTCQRYDMTLQTLGAYGTVVMDEEQVRKDTRLREMIHRSRRTGLSFRGMSYQPSHDSIPTRINGTVNFAPSHLSAGVQLADFVAGVVWRKYERSEEERFNRIEPLFYRRGNRRFEPSLVPR
jgi:hypothetical protein